MLAIFSKKKYDTMSIYVLSPISTRIKSAWKMTDEIYMNTSSWHGWLLIYLTKQCFRNC